MKNRYHPFFPKLQNSSLRLLLVSLLSIIFFPVVSRSQYYDLTQGLRTVPTMSIGASITNNFGHFVIGGSGSKLSLLGNSGNVIVQSASNFTSNGGGGLTPNFALAANHRRVGFGYPRIAVVSFKDDGGNTNLAFHHYAEGPSEGMNIRGNILSSDPANENYFDQIPLPNCAGGGRDFGGLEAAMDQRFLYISWVSCSAGGGAGNTYWYAVYDFESTPVSTWVIPPTQIPKPGGGFASGFTRPTVSCNRWSDGSNPNGAQIAFSYFNGVRSVPAFFRPNPNGNTTVAFNLLEPNINPINCRWVRVQEFDERDGGAEFHYFYSYQGGAAAGLNTLYSTDNNAVSGAISTRLAEDNFVPALSAAYGYSISDDHSVFCAFREKTINPVPNEHEVKICRQMGANIQSITVALNISQWTLGCNQMGIMSVVQSGTTQFWRSIKPFKTRVTEFTLASGLCHFTRGIDPLKPHISIGDQVRRDYVFRIYEPDGSPRIQSFKFMSNSPGHPLMLSAGVPFDDGDGGNINNGQRAHLILDNGATIDFNNHVQSEIQASSNGRIEYNGAIFINGDRSILGVEGNFNTTDSTETYRGLMFVNAPGTWPNMILKGRKGQITFAPATTQTAMKKITLSGPNAGIDIDDGYLYLGSRHESEGLTQLEVIGSSNSNELQTVSLINSYLNTGFQYAGLEGTNIDPDVARPQGWRSDIALTRSNTIVINSNKWEYAKITIINPITTVQFGGNNCFAIRDLFDMRWTVSDNSVFSGEVDVFSNTVFRNWPFVNGETSDPATVYRIYGFNVPDQFDVRFDNNAIFDDWRYNANSIGLHLAYGTNAVVTDCLMEMQGIGVLEEIVTNGNTFYCSNIFQVNLFCPDKLGIGVKQVGDQGTSFVKKNRFLHKEKGFFAGGSNRSTMIRNDFQANHVGAHIEDFASTIFTGSHTGEDDYAGFNLFSENRDFNVELLGWANNTVQPEFGAPTSMLLGDIDSWGQNIFADYNHNGFNNKHMKFTEMSGGTYNTNLNVPISGNQMNPAAVVGASPTWLIAANGDPEIIKISHKNKENGDVPRGDYFCGGGASPLSKGVSALSTSVPDDLINDSLYLYNAALNWEGIDYRLALDTMRLYCEEHPFATEYPGQIYLGIRYTNMFTGRLSETSVDKWRKQYAWLEGMQSLNDDRKYQIEVLRNMCAALTAYDRNAAANLWYNLTLIYEECYEIGWTQIENIREYQGYIDEDTTAFFVINKIQPKGAVALLKNGDNSGIIIKAVTSEAGRLDVTLDSRREQDITFEVYDLVGVLRHSETVKNAYMGQHHREMKLNLSGPAFMLVRTESGSQTIPLIVR